MNSLPTARLDLFGSPALRSERGTILTGPAAQRHRLALLALLALAGERGVSRDWLTAHLWPESDPERGRNLLSVSVYVLRNALRDDALLSEGTDLRLNALAVTTDVMEFAAALDRGDAEQAVRLYGAPFMDGFFLPDAPEFERWVDRERSRLAAAAARALETLAETAEQEQAFPAATDWWRARAGLDPYDTRVAVRLMKALEASGNRSAALQHAAIHQRLIAEEFGAEPDPEVLELAEQIRHRPGRRADSTPMRGAPAAPDATEPRVEPSAVPEEGPIAEPSFVRRAPRRLRLALRYGATAMVLAAVLGGGSRLLRERPGIRSETTLEPPSLEVAPLALAERSVAVLPMANLSAAAEDASLASGMTEALIAMLWETGSLRVVAVTPGWGFAESGLDASAVGNRVGAATVLESSVQKVGSRLRLRVRLVDTADESTRWSETYDRELNDVFAVQDEIGGAVAAELGARLSGVAGARPHAGRPRSIAAYELYLRGVDRTLLRSDSAAQEGVELLRQAIALDSTYASAWAGLALMYGRAASGVPMPERERYHALAEAAALRSVALDDSLAGAQATLGVVRMTAFDFAAAERHLTRAIELDENRAESHEWIVTLYLSTGRPDEALAHARRALEIDPLSPYAHAEAARALLGNDRCDEALELLAKLNGLRPPLLRAAPIAAHCYARKHMWPEAIAALRPVAATGEPHSLAQLAYVLGRAGQREEAGRILRGLLKRMPKGDVGAYEIALVYAGLGDLDRTFVWLDRAVDDRSLTGTPGKPTHLLLSGPLFEELRSDPRFRSLRERLGSKAE